jgi:hypothetical protein
MSYMPDRRSVLPALLLCLSVCAAVTPLVAQNEDDSDFVLVREDHPITLHERWINYPGKQPAILSREVKSEFLVNASIYKILAIIQDESQIRNWQRNVEKFKIYRKADSTCWDEYTYHDAPWPVSDQDHYLTYKLVETKPGEEIQIRFESASNESVPIYDGVTRLVLNGSWLMQQLGPGKAKVVYRVQSVPSGAPRLLTDPVVRSNLMSSIKSLKELAEK